MIDQWMQDDLNTVFEQHNIAVLIDEHEELSFLLEQLKVHYQIIEAHTEMAELHTKYLIEKDPSRTTPILIYTHRAKNKLKFIREYCETAGCVEVRHLEHFIKDKLHQQLQLNIHLPKEELITAAKLSVGKDQAFWQDIAVKGLDEIFDSQADLLPFIHDPEGNVNQRFDHQLKKLFFRKIHRLMHQEYMEKPAKTLAKELVHRMLDGLCFNQIDDKLFKLYTSWLDSVRYRTSFDTYLKQYHIPKQMDIWDVHSDHPFREIDEQWLAEVGSHISNRAKIKSYLPKLKKRQESQQAASLAIDFWKDVITLLEFNPIKISHLNSLEECVDYYTRHFSALDTAIRKLYTAFLSNTELLTPFQNIYKEYVAIFLDKWFNYWSDYQSNQTGTLQRIIDESEGQRVAVIVGDGVAYEMAELVAKRVNKTAKLTKMVILADIPSITENNMSRIYMDNGLIEGIQAKREKYLKEQNKDKSLAFIRLDEVSSSQTESQILICTYKDIDDMGEKLQQKALKYFPETIDFFGNQISNLLNIGYTKVYLITDHGFVLTGLLSESDKISLDLNGDVDKSERYIRSVKKQHTAVSLIEVERSYGDYKYVYFSKTMNPFKTPGLYGFSHGGLSPQELITPCFCWEGSSASSNNLSVSIRNKEDLKQISGALFTIKLKSESQKGDLFSVDRKVQLVFFSNQQEFQRSEILTMTPGDLQIKEYATDRYSEIEVHLLDAFSKELIDKASIRQNNDRDLDGLL